MHLIGALSRCASGGDSGRTSHNIGVLRNIADSEQGQCAFAACRERSTAGMTIHLVSRLPCSSRPCSLAAATGGTCTYSSLSASRVSPPRVSPPCLSRPTSSSPELCAALASRPPPCAFPLALPLALPLLSLALLAPPPLARSRTGMSTWRQPPTWSCHGLGRRSPVLLVDGGRSGLEFYALCPCRHLGKSHSTTTLHLHCTLTRSCTDATVCADRVGPRPHHP